MKMFIKRIFIYFIIFTIILIPVNIVFSKVGSARIFNGSDNLIKDMEDILTSDNPFFSDYKNSKRVNVLIMGVNDGLTDTIMLASYDMDNQRVDVISIPRDTYYPRQGVKSAAAQKINAIYRGNGVVGTAEAVSDLLLGMPVNYYMVVDYDNVEKIVDAIGGVPVDIAFHMHYEDKYDKPPLYIDFPAGHHVLKGKEAAKYLRFRKGSPGYKSYPEGDIGRVKAQQEFIKSAFRESLGFGLPKVASTVVQNVESDLTVGIAVKIAQKAIGLNAEALTTYTVPGKAGMANNLSYWYANKEETEKMIGEIYN